MGTVQAVSQAERNWRGWYGYTDLDGIEPYCVIDSLTYGVGEVTWTTPTGGRRQLGLRPLWPDSERERVYADFYAQLKASVAKFGVKVPVLLYRIHGKRYCRYGASRLHVARSLNFKSVLTIVCDFDDPEAQEERYPAGSWIELLSPAGVLHALGDIKAVGTFEVSHERIDIHNVVPWEA